MPTTAAWGFCPECEAGITAEQATCKACGFPLKPKPALPPGPPAAPATTGATTRTRKRRKARPSPAAHEEPSSAIVFALLGLFIPLLAVFGLVQSRKGSAACILSWVGIGLWIAGVLLIASKVALRVG